MPTRWLPRAKSLRLMGKAVYGRLATCGKDGTPYITPVNFVLIGGSVYIHCGFAGRKLDNLEHSSRVCFEVSAPGRLSPGPRARDFTMRYWSVLGFGAVRRVEDPADKLRVMNRFMEKYARGRRFRGLSREDMKDVNLLEIALREVSGKVSVDPKPGSSEGTG